MNSISMRNIFLVFLCSVLVFGVVNDTTAQQAPSPKKENLWKTLSKITFKKQYDEMMGFKVDVPVFSDAVQALDGKEVTVKGYIIPVEGYKSHTEFIFSAFPYNMCYFCGGAGPETVMEVSSLEPIKYTAEPVTIKGILQLNSGDINKLIYSITKVKKIED